MGPLVHLAAALGAYHFRGEPLAIMHLVLLTAQVLLVPYGFNIFSRCNSSNWPANLWNEYKDFKSDSIRVKGLVMLVLLRVVPLRKSLSLP